MENCTNKWFGLIFVPAGKICFDTFVAISAWFMVDTAFKASRFVKVWLEILFYNVVFLALTALLGDGYTNPVTFRQWLGAFFPMIGNTHGFAASFAVYCLIVPFLKFIADRLTKKSAGLLALILIVTQSMSQLFGSYIGYVQPMASEILLFVMFYFIAFYLKRWPLRIQNCKPLLAVIVFGLWGMLCYMWYRHSMDPTGFWPGFIIGVGGSEFSINNVVAGFALLLLVKDIKMPHMPVVNTIATTTLGILIYHDHNFFRPVVWHRFIKASTWYYVQPLQFIAYVVIATLAVFFVGVVLDLARQYLLERPITRSKAFTRICARIDGLFAPADNNEQLQ